MKTIMEDTLFSTSNSNEAARISLHSPSLMPNATGYLWNSNMLLQMNCRGFANAQYMNPEPCKYSVGPALEATTFMQPEQPYYAHHPGRFFYIKNHSTNELISIPFEPCRTPLDKFEFIQKDTCLEWHINHWGLDISLSVSLIDGAPIEQWSLTVTGEEKSEFKISIYSYFSIGYRSWMYQEADYVSSEKAVIAKVVTPYQKVEDYFKNQTLKELTFCLSNTEPTSWCANQQCFEGDGGLHSPDAIKAKWLANKDARYETPVAVMQFDHSFTEHHTFTNTWLFGACNSQQDLVQLRQHYFNNRLDENECSSETGEGFSINGLAPELNAVINKWLPRQIRYIADTNRLTTDPQTRNYLQDHLGVCYLNSPLTRQALITAISQQKYSGEMPDGILLHEHATLKYINQVPHADHAVWLTLTLQTYLDETNDIDILTELCRYQDKEVSETVTQHIEKALANLLNKRDYRGLSFIEQGDWCDPMNMVGYKGKGVSGWLTLATAYAVKCWCYIVRHYINDYCENKLADYEKLVIQLNQAVNSHLWAGSWYARGITDDGRVFGTANDNEGQIYLNPQSWAILSGATTPAKRFSLLNEVENKLSTPFGMMMLAPAYTQMQQDIGRLTQKYPGVAENGSVYNHAAAFYAYALYQVGEYNQAYLVLKKMVPSIDDAIARGQLPNFIPNYYRGAYNQLKDRAGRSSHLINTGTCAWYYRCIIEELCGFKGQAGKLIVKPKLPEHISYLSGTRLFMQAEFHFVIEKSAVEQQQIWLDQQPLTTNVIGNIVAGQQYQVKVVLPK